MATAHLAALAIRISAATLDAASGNYRIIAVVSGCWWLTIKSTLGNSGGVYWFSLLHAMVTGVGGALCAYLDFFGIPSDQVQEPLRSVQCAPALSPLHTILPMITLGYALSDLLEGLHIGKWDFIYHGLVLGLCCLILCEMGLSHVVGSALIMEISSIPYNFVSVKWRIAGVDMAVNVLFMVSFFVSRIVAFPILWSRWLYVYHAEVVMRGKESCYSSTFVCIVLVFGIAFHALNLYWMVLISRKAYRKVFGRQTDTAKED